METTIQFPHLELTYPGRQLREEQERLLAPCRKLIRLRALLDLHTLGEVCAGVLRKQTYHTLKEKNNLERYEML